jgi:hypothetical protein
MKVHVGVIIILVGASSKINLSGMEFGFINDMITIGIV